MFIYCREAHAIDSDRPTQIAQVEQPLTLDERREVAAKFLKETPIPFTSLLDTIDDKASKAYVALPDRLYLVGQDGKIAYAGGRGPRGFRPNELEDAIGAELTKLATPKPSN